MAKRKVAASPLVDSGSTAPAGPADECFWCKQQIGSPHRSDCVAVKRRVRLRYTFEVDVDMPADWTPAHIVRHRIKGTWCADNAMQELQAQQAVAGECLCDRFVDCTFVRDIDPVPRVRPPKTPSQLRDDAAFRGAMTRAMRGNAGKGVH